MLIIIVLISALSASAQQIGNGRAATITNFNTQQLSGMYSTTALQSGFPAAESGISTWLWVSRTANTDRNYQMQIASSLKADDRLFFRKLDIQSLADAGSNDKWHELATRGKNIFTDDQFISINKSLYLGSDTDPTRRLRFQFIGSSTSGDSYIDYGGSLYFRGTSGSEFSNPVISFDKDGNVTIGLQSTIKKKLRVNGNIVANEIQVKSDVWADHVFKDGYQLPSLTEVKAHIDENKHLPGIPTEAEVKENGVDLGEMQVKLLQKIEELTLYVIQQEATIQELKSAMEKITNNP